MIFSFKEFEFSPEGDGDLLKDFKQGMNVSRSAIKHAASGSRWSEVSQTGGRRSSQKMAVGAHMRLLEDFCLTENAS